MRRELTILLLCIGLLVSGCGGSGGGSAMMDDMEPTTPPVTPPAPPDEEEEEEEPAQPSARTLALIDGIVNPSVAGDPSTARPTTHNSRPGQSAGETFSVTAGGMALQADATGKAHIPQTLIGTDKLGVDDPSLGVQFEVKGPADNLGEFASQVYERQTRPTITDTVTVFSNVEPVKPVLYTTYYDATNGGDRPAVESVITDATSDDYGQITINGDEVKANGGLFSATAFPRNATPETYEDADAKKFTGSFNGVPGTFMCGATADCEARADKDGKLVSLGTTADSTTNDWTFKPDGDLKTLKVENARYDADYLSFGYWVSERETASTSRFAVGTFYAGSQAYTGNGADVATSIAALTGSATYVGEAAGMYAIKGDATDAGDFTANANLTARFGGGATAGRFAISGTITDLINGSGEEIDPSWTVNLESATFASADGTNGVTEFDGRTTGNGNWEGGFFGNPTTGTAGTAGANEYPMGVAGEFTSHFENGHVIGAFGATRR